MPFSINQENTKNFIGAETSRAEPGKGRTGKGPKRLATGGGDESSLLLQFILYIFFVCIMFIMGNRTLYIYIIAEEWLKEKVGVIQPKWK